MATKKPQITVIGTVEIDTDLYPDDATVQQMVEIDIENDSAAFFDGVDIQSVVVVEAK